MRPKIVYNRHEIDSTETKRGSLGPCVGSRKGDEKKNHMDNWESTFLIIISTTDSQLNSPNCRYEKYINMIALV